jgi:hypothetical protein
VEQAYCNIAMQRIVSNHTYIWLIVRTRHEMGRETTEYWFASILMWQFRLLPPDECGGLQGMDRAITTCRLPLNQRKGNVFACSLVPELTPVYKETTHIPLGLQPYGSTSIGHGHT